MKKHFGIKLIAMLLSVSLLSGCNSSISDSVVTSTSKEPEVTISTSVEVSVETSTETSTETETTTSTEPVEEQKDTLSFSLIITNKSGKALVFAIFNPWTKEQQNFTDHLINPDENIKINLPEWPLSFEFLYVAVFGYEDNGEFEMVREDRVPIDSITQSVEVVISGDNAENGEVIVK